MKNNNLPGVLETQTRPESLQLLPLLLLLPLPFGCVDGRIRRHRNLYFVHM
jgi:hypothetical protein